MHKNSKTNKYKIDKIKVTDLKEIMRLRFNSTFLQQNSFFSNLGKKFTEEIFKALIKSKTCLCKKISYYDQEKTYIDSYIIISKDILLTSLELGIKLILIVTKKIISSLFSKNKISTCTNIINIIRIYLSYIFCINFFQRACFIELCHNTESIHISSPLILTIKTVQELKKLNITKIKFSYYKNNPTIFIFVSKITDLLNGEIYKVSEIKINPNNIIIAFPILKTYQLFINYI